MNCLKILVELFQRETILNITKKLSIFALKKISLFVDKQISKNKNFLINNKFKLLNFGSLYGGFGMSFCDDFLKFKKEYKKRNLKF